MPIADSFFGCPPVFFGSSEVHFDEGRGEEYFLCCREDRLLLQAGTVGSVYAFWLVSESSESSWDIQIRE